MFLCLLRSLGGFLGFYERRKHSDIVFSGSLQPRALSIKFLSLTFVLFCWVGLFVQWRLGGYWNYRIILWCQLSSHRTGDSYSYLQEQFGDVVKNLTLSLFLCSLLSSSFTIQKRPSSHLHGSCHLPKLINAGHGSWICVYTVVSVDYNIHRS